MRPWIFLSAVFSAAAFSSARIPVAILYAEWPDLDSAGREELAKELGRTLALDSAFLVYDVRAKHAGVLDRVFAMESGFEDELRRVGGGEIRYGLTVRCRSEDSALACGFAALDLKGNGAAAPDSAYFESAVLRRPADLRSLLIAKLRALLPGGNGEERLPGPALRLRTAARFARLLRGEEILARGAVDSIPLGATLQTGEGAGEIAARVPGYFYILFPHSSYSHPQPGVLCLNQGTLGMVIADSAAAREALVITPSCLLRGKPGAMLLRQRGDLSRIELASGEMTVLPVLGSQAPGVLRGAEWGETRGYDLENGSLSQELADSSWSRLRFAIPGAKGSRKPLFGAATASPRRALPAFAVPVREYFASALAEIGAAPDPLEKDSGAPFAGAAETGSHARGCYLCRPDRLGP